MEIVSQAVKAGKRLCTLTSLLNQFYTLNTFSFVSDQVRITSLKLLEDKANFEEEVVLGMNFCLNLEEPMSGKHRVK